MPNKPSDQRAYVRIAVEMPDNPKIAALDDPVASWAHIVAICYSGEHLTDGVFPVAAILRKACAARTKADKLVRAGLWHKPGHDCDTCPQPLAGHAVVHDYLKHQHAGSYVRTVSDVRSAAGRKGAAQRWQTDGNGYSKRHSKPDGTEVANDMAPPLANAWQTSCQEVRSKNSCKDLGGYRYESDARANATEPPEHSPTSTNRPPERCAKHNNSQTDPGPCRGCMRAREHAEQWDRDQRLTRVMADRSCGLCDADGWRYEPGTRIPLTPYERCDHRQLRSVS